MLWITHAVFAILFVFPFYITSGNGNLILFGFAILGASFPDIDHPKSYISSLNPLTQFFSKQISRIAVHRGIFHTLIMAVAVFIITALLVQYLHASFLYSFFFFIGYISHLVADSLNPTGVRWLRPFRENLVSFRIRTGSGGEDAICVLIVIFLTLLGLWCVGLI